MTRSTKALQSLQDYQHYLREATLIQSETIRRLIADDSTPPLEMAAVLEDIANHFLDISDEIRDFALAEPQAVVQSASADRAAADPA